MFKPIKSVSKLLLVVSLLGGMAVVPMTAEAAPLAAGEQTSTAKGLILDEFGDPMIGASIRVVGNASQGAATNIDGEFSIANVKVGTKLQITAVGYKPFEAVWQGTPLEVKMELNTQQLEEVVVTAMGIKREEKTLTYAVQTIKNDEVTRIKETNFVNALQGKSAGLNITPNNSGAGGGASRIVLRGSTSILGNNQPLIVLDGVPMQNGMGGQATDLGVSGERSGDDLLSTINPEDIENMTILKGPNAAALYGSAANNGVIVITTKSGAQGTVKVDISSSTSIDRIAMYPKQQHVYGITDTGTFQHNQYSSWGPKIGTRDADDLAANPWLRNAGRNAADEFFQTGITLNNGITLSGGTENTRSYFSYNNTWQKGVMPGNDFVRNNVMLKESFSLFDKRVNLNVSLNWINQRTRNAPVTGKALSSLFALYRTPGDVDMRYFKNHYSHLGSNLDALVTDKVTGNARLYGQPIQTWNWFVEYLNNPFWVSNMVNDIQKRDRILGNVTLDWKIWGNLKYQTRFSVDMVFNNNLNEEWATMFRTSHNLGGKYYSGRSHSYDLYNDHMLTWNDRFADKIDVNVAAGGSFTRHYSRSVSIRNNIDTSGVPNAFVPSNNNLIRPGYPGSTHTDYGDDSWDYTDWSSALFVTASVGLFDKVYIDGSYRRDWCQSFQQFASSGDNISFGYYSFGANVLIDKFLPRLSWLDQLKWRASYSVVGNGVPNQLFGRQSLNFNTGAITAKPPTFDDPKPETTTAFETGLDTWLFNNKLNFDITYYNSTLKNQFLWVSTGSGESRPINTGKIRNYGIELSVGYRWAIGNGWTWQSNANFAYNSNKILETYVQENGVPYVYETGPAAFHVKYIKGGKYGDIYVNSFMREQVANPAYDADAAAAAKEAGLKYDVPKMIDGTNIKVAYATDANGNIDYENSAPSMATGEYKTYAGNTVSPYTLGWNNTITWKNWTLYFLIDGRIGGKVMSLTEPDLDRFGVSTRSAAARLAAEADPENLMWTNASGKQIHLMYLPDGSGRKISVQRYYETIGQRPMEDHLYDATNFRMRDISLSYAMPNLFGKSKGMTAQFSVKNAFFLYKDSPVDPDISVSAANGFSGIDSYALPTLRSYCITLKFNF